MIGICQDMAAALNKCGPAIIEGHLDTICSNALLILEQKSMCQQDPDQVDEDEAPDEDEQAEYDSVLISADADLIGALAFVIGEDFQQAFGAFLPQLTKYYVSRLSRLSSK